MTPHEAFEDMYQHLEKISKEFGIDYTYLNTLKLVIEERKLKKVPNTIIKFAKAYNKTLDMLYRNCVTISKKYNSENKIHLTYLRKQIDLIQKEL